MTDTERVVNGACERIVRAGVVYLYRDLYKDLRQRLPCGEACRLIEAGLRCTRYQDGPDYPCPSIQAVVGRARAMAALVRLARWAGRREWGPWERLVREAAGEM